MVGKLLGKKDLPTDLPGTFESVSGDFWYFVFFCLSKMNRGEEWVSRLVFHSQVLENLVLLMRVEAGALERWEGGHAAENVEQLLSQQRLTQLQSCVPGEVKQGLVDGLKAADRLGREVIQSVASQRGWTYAVSLAERSAAILARL